MADERDSKIIKAQFPVWIARDMVFNNPPGRNEKKYIKYTEAMKVKYNKEILLYLDMKEEKSLGKKCDTDRAVAIKLDRRVRYVWRSDILTKSEYDEIKEKQKTGLGNLRQKCRRAMGKGESG